MPGPQPGDEFARALRALSERWRAVGRIPVEPEPIETPWLGRDEERHKELLEALDAVRRDPTEEPGPASQEELEAEVAKRIAAGKPRRGPLTVAQIAERCRVSRRRVRNVQAEQELSADS